MASAAGAKVIVYEYLEQRQFAPELEKLQQSLKRKAAPRVLVINSPHNPTGQMLDETTLKELLLLRDGWEHRSSWTKSFGVS